MAEEESQRRRKASSKERKHTYHPSFFDKNFISLTKMLQDAKKRKATTRVKFPAMTAICATE